MSLSIPDQSSSFSSEDASNVTATDFSTHDYDYLSKIIIIGPSGVGKSCILHRFVKGDWNILTSQTIGVEFSSKIVTVGHSTSRIRMKMQLWDTAGQERFRSLTRSYYRGSAGVVLVYDVTSKKSFLQLHEFISDIKSLTNDTISVVVVGNKSDLVSRRPIDPTLIVSDEAALDFCSHYSQELGFEIPFIKSSALNADNIESIFDKLSNMILTKVEMGLLDPEDPLCGVQYGDMSRWDQESVQTGEHVLKKKPTTISLIDRRSRRYVDGGWRCC